MAASPYPPYATSSIFVPATASTATRILATTRPAWRVLPNPAPAYPPAIAATAQPGDHVLVMSNGGFGGVHQKLLERLGR